MLAALEAADRHAQAFSLYLERRWSEAIVVLREQLERRPSDGPTRILLERCERWAASPAPSDWDGIERMTEK